MNLPRPTSAPLDPARLRFALTVTAVFAVLVTFMLGRHEMWGDEMQAWMIARDSESLGDLFANTRYEGHAPLWYLVLYGLSRVSRAPVMMQAAHGAFATIAAFVVVWLAPFPRRWRALIPFGYFLAYDYAIVSRPYVLGVLVLFAFCALRRARPRATVTAALLLALLANTSLYGALLAGAGALSLAIDVLSDGRWRDRATRLQLTRAAAVLGVGIVTAGVWMAPPRSFLGTFTGPPDAHAVSANDPTMKELATIGPFVSFAPVPNIRAFPTLWNTNLFLAGGGRRRVYAAALVGALLLLAGMAVVRRRRAALVFVAAYSVAHLAFSAFVRQGQLYHHGYLFLAFLAALWLAWPDALATTHEPEAGRWDRREMHFVDALLGIQVAAAAIVLATDVSAPFDPGQATAAYLARTGADRQLVLSGWAFPASVIAGYLDRPIAYVDYGYTGTFVRWNRRRRFERKDAEGPTLDAAVQASRATNRGWVTVLLERPVLRSRPDASVTLLHASRRPMRGAELFVYSVQARAAEVPPAGQQAK